MIVEISKAILDSVDIADSVFMEKFFVLKNYLKKRDVRVSIVQYLSFKGCLFTYDDNAGNIGFLLYTVNNAIGGLGLISIFESSYSISAEFSKSFGKIDAIERIVVPSSSGGKALIRSCDRICEKCYHGFIVPITVFNFKTDTTNNQDIVECRRNENYRMNNKDHCCGQFLWPSRILRRRRKRK